MRSKSLPVLQSGFQHIGSMRSWDYGADKHQNYMAEPVMVMKITGKTRKEIRILMQNEKDC